MVKEMSSSFGFGINYLTTYRGKDFHDLVLVLVDNEMEEDPFKSVYYMYMC
jgi:hypothetical protein